MKERTEKIVSSSNGFNRLKSYIEYHYTDNVSVQQLSDYFGISYNTIERRFKESIGCSPVQYIAEMRVKKACEYLSHTTLNLDEIATAVGYQDKYYFSKVFKRLKGITPGAYRRANSKIPAINAKSLSGGTEIHNIVISNYNRVTIYRTIPRRILCVSYYTAEVCIALGLGDRIVGIVETESSLSDCRPEYRDVISKLYLLRKRNSSLPTFHEIEKLEPDFVYGPSYSFIEESGIADIDEFEKHGINVYVSKTTYSTLSTLSDVYEDIHNIGKIFDRLEQARIMVSEMQYELHRIKEGVCKTSPKKVLLYVAEINGKVLTFGMGIESFLLKAANGINIFEKYPIQRILRDWKEIAKRNPEIIFVHMSSRDKIEDIIERVKDNEAIATTDAIKNNKIFPVSLEHTFPGLHCIELVDMFAKLINTAFDEKVQ